MAIDLAQRGKEVARITFPNRNERMDADGRSAPGFLDSEWLTPEPVVRDSQYFLNPILYQYAKQFPHITLLPGTTFQRYDSHENHVTVLAESSVSDTSLEVEGTYLIGCDGGRSAVRKQMGVKFSGDARVSRPGGRRRRSRFWPSIFHNLSARGSILATTTTTRR